MGQFRRLKLGGALNLRGALPVAPAGMLGKLHSAHAQRLRVS